MKNELNKEYTEQLDKRLGVEQPNLYQVVISNDDFTPMEFVVGILEKFFFMDRRRAVEVMQEAHKQGKALCGAFTKDFAEAKVSQVIDYARTHEHPLHCSMETV